ncbi:hypothetical protein A1O7_09374 [Cladophialophora yegresii CBS 114405]|uniref:PH domain-containing protein n=1 Tax=Cladophialophora yegresii CBS 114405 TaxID=1182544 RepID=W9VEI8_9EURO|nr:uncharacterized protein A1O7_09374 [Cladophialophora yegresii CBS 114405]EXJ54037.1 hypothetical protein A1O7_09374 [Cladophialophora yegresii CBS 114405]
MNIDAQQTPAQSAQPQKFLRYRSVRKSATKDAEPQSSRPLPQTSPSASTRLPPRYHRRPPATQSAPPPTVPRLPPDNGHATLPRIRGNTFGGVVDADEPINDRADGGRRMVIQQSSPRAGTRQMTSNITSRKPPSASTGGVSEPEGFRRSYEAAREEARLILEGEHDRLIALRQAESRRRHQERERRRKEQENAQEVAHKHQAEEQALRKPEESVNRAARVESVRERQNASQLVHGIEREEDAVASTGPAMKPQRNSTSSKMCAMVIGEPAASQQDTRRHRRRASSAVEQPQQRPNAGRARRNSAGRVDQVPGVEAPPMKPNYDAPISAVNAGERRVTLKCREAFITLPVTLSTTAKDILKSASLCMSESIDPNTAIVLESFSQLGLERPLRRYERIRDVMNSWDNDSQNHLFIMAAGEFAASALHTADAPRQQPYGTTVQIYHSQRPGKWDKRWLKLREDGQITTSKNEKGIDSTNICHVSDFDVYTPTTKQLIKLKPPKKLCYALKSQEKCAVFLEGANFVHFFCTKDKEIADIWYHAVHAWRSWYLVNMLGEGQRQPAEPNVGPQLGRRPGTGDSKESLPYVLGSFKPLLDSGTSFEIGRNPELGSVRRPSQTQNQRPLIDLLPARPSFDEIATGSKLPTKSSVAPPTAFPKKFMVESATNCNGVDEDGPFTGTGLLARSASRRAQGGSRAGHAAAGADGKPLVDLASTSDFTDGSLLRRMETIAARQGAFEPKIDRQKRREVEVAVGEGF